MSKDLTTFVGNSFGLQLKEGKDLVSLPRYLFGIQQTGSETPTTYSTSPEQDISKEIHKRLLSNLPYYYKSKGTKRALEGLINAYGIPSSILRIREYGGPDLPGKQITAEIKRKFARALNFDGTAHRVEIFSSVSFSLKDKEKEIELLYDKEEMYLSYSNSGSTAAVLNAERETNKQLVLLLADKVADRISLTIVEENL